MGERKIRLSDVERKLVCGDPRNEGWREVPFNEAEYFLRSFLQQRGFHEPKFVPSASFLDVDPGPQSRVRRLDARGLPQGFDPGKLRKLKGQVLTPKTLDKIKAALFDGLQDRGYACPKVSLSADPRSGIVTAQVVTGRIYDISTIEPAKLEGLDPAIFNRYEAFEYGKPFDMRLLSLTAQRTLADALFVSSYYDVSCSTDAKLSIVQRVMQGKPRLYQVGVGFDTEEYGIVKAQWRNSRIGMRASTLEGTLYGSYRQQSASTFMRYYLRPSSRLYLKPALTYLRQNELQFESSSSEADLFPSSSWENQAWRVDVSGGPLVRHVDTERGPGPVSDTFLGFSSELDFQDHWLEYYTGEPREGWRNSFTSISRIAGAYSNLTAHRFSVQGERLWNLGHYIPPWLVIGDRWWAGSTYVTDRTAALANLTPDMRFFVGGDENFRGADRTQLPGDNDGFFSAAYDGLELRLGDVLPVGLEPFAFLDGAMGGRQSFHLDADVYWAPGAGLRWRLPFGSIRGTLARGLDWHRDPSQPPLLKPHWQLFFSFGREF